MSTSVKIVILIYVLAVLLFSIGCRNINQAPISHIYVVDIQNQVCSKRKITDKKTLASFHVEDLPLEACDGNVSLSFKEYLDLRTYLKQIYEAK